MPAPVVDPIAAQTLDGWDTATVTATASNSPTSWTFTVVAGNVTLAGSNGTRTFRVPPQLAAGQVVIAVTATNASGTSDAVNAVVNVKPWPAWAWVGQIEGLLDDADSATDVWDGNAPAAAVNVLDGGTATSATDVWDGNVAAVNVLDGGTATLSHANVSAVDVLDGGTAISSGRWAALSPLQNPNHTYTPTAGFIDAVGGTDFIDAVGASDLIDGRGA